MKITPVAASAPDATRLYDAVSPEGKDARDDTALHGDLLEFCERVTSARNGVSVHGKYELQDTERFFGRVEERFSRHGYNLETNYEVVHEQ